MNLEQLGTYAPYLVIVIMFFSNYGIFVTPKHLDEKLKDYVLKETYNLAYSEMKADLKEMKEKIDKMYDKFCGVD